MELDNAIKCATKLLAVAEQREVIATTRDGNSNAVDLVRYVESTLGFTILGAGYYSMVFSHPSCPSKAIKLCVKREKDASETYYTLCRAKPSLHRPAVYDMQVSGNYMVAVIDKLEPMNRKATRVYDEHLGWFYRDKSTHPAAIDLREAIEFLAPAGYHVDLHSHNVMMNKNGHIVITDPFSDNNSPEKSRALRTQIEQQFALHSPIAA